MRHINQIGTFMDKIKSLGKRQHYVDMSGYKSHYEQVGEI
jgi:hypothetical protein